jgi:hypothetical protein
MRARRCVGHFHSATGVRNLGHHTVDRYRCRADRRRAQKKLIAKL